MASDWARRCDLIEECYEYLLAYAASGVSGEGDAKAGQVRHLLQRAVESLDGISEACAEALIQFRVPEDEFRPFLAVLERDARDSSAAIAMVRSQPMISAQLVDNLNASLHLRALLTDLFLIDEVVKLHASAEAAAGDSANGA